MTSCPPRSHKDDILGVLAGNFFKFGTSVHLDSGKKRQGHGDFAKHSFGHNSGIYMIIMTKLHNYVYLDISLYHIDQLSIRTH